MVIIVTRNKDRKTPISFNLRKYVESIETARSECTAKHKNKGSYNIDYIVPDLIEFLWQWLKSDQNADWKKKYLYL